jgi:hypothetical protein
MTELLKKEKKFTWTESYERNFQELKRRLTTAPVLTLPDIQRDFSIYSDVSRQGLECVLMQDGKVVAYASDNSSLMSRITQPMIWSLQT